MMTAEPVTIARLTTMVLRMPLDHPMPTAFGLMDARATLLVRLEDRDGAFGWGEIWCNFPTFGGEHRAQLAERIVGPLLLGTPVVPGEAAAGLETRLATLALQTGEFGPLAQVIGGIDMALWDLAAGRAGVPLHRLLGSTTDDVPAYASGINPTRPGDTVRRAQAEGFRAFKLKLGFGRERDLANAEEVAAALQPGETFMVDANQGWQREEACAMAAALLPLGPQWLEEPLPADASRADWSAVADIGIPIAAGENMRGLGAFEDALDAEWLSVAQPDAGKWGGISGGLAVARRALSAGRRFCPHHLAGAIGLLHAAHLLAAAGGDGLLETDSNDNPLRTALVGDLPPLQNGRWPLPSGPGLGREPDRAAVTPWIARETEIRGSMP
ncbi:mandelate racemase/muconate lactonizing enzyme family protein [Acuticoccus sp. M5D2P5]|uniref:mandelate racemase/muconate lactonizing enzyme family protein n=1 Tax=Acuticoccus kalidii TaxID=2910977 RepID=UPI001F20D8D0|nr:mandelate racemase/muconate lactonizing enzyme family protein [Acuticoccus kalidii]MCF3936675.1 mandelate racemase/muconate lactonizing enzyme family protein [Acuticoccus kalidii]